MPANDTGGPAPIRRSFFRAGDARSLNLFRFLYCLGLSMSLMYTHDRYMSLLLKAQYHPIPLFRDWGVGLMSPLEFRLLYFALIILLLMGAIGLFARVTFPLAATAFFFYMGTSLSLQKSPYTDYVFHSTNIVFFILLILGVTEKVTMWGVDELRKRNWRWTIPDPTAVTMSPLPILTIKAALAIAYFGAGYCKVITDWRWADGTTLQCYLLAKYLIVDTEIGFWLAQSWTMCLVMGIMTLWLELTFFVIIFFPRLEWIYIISGLGFHASILLTMKINFFLYFGLTYIVFLDWPRLMWLVHQLDRPLRHLRGDPPVRLDWAGLMPPPVPPPPPSLIPFGRRPMQHYAMIFLIILLSSHVVSRVESWPFSDYRVFEDRRQFNQIKTYRIAGIDSIGKYHWLGPAETRSSPVSLNSRMRHFHQQRNIEGMRALLNLIAEKLPPVRKSDFKRLVLVRREVRQNERGHYVPVEREMLHVTLQ